MLTLKFFSKQYGKGIPPVENCCDAENYNTHKKDLDGELAGRLAVSF